MRLIICLTSILATVNQCSSIPFGSRVKELMEDEDGVATDNHDSSSEQSNNEKTTTVLRGAASKVSQSTQEQFTQTSSIISTFFENPLDTYTSATLQQTIRQMSATEEMQTFLQTTRRSLHRQPELMFELPHTSSTIQTILKELDITYTTGWAKNTHPDVWTGDGGYGIVAHVGSQNKDEPCIILRADMDALPIVEATSDIDYKSKEDGKMHACGHDGHVTMLLGAAALLKKMEEEMEGTVRLVFQPAEEGGAGMKRMIDEGLVTLEPKAELAFGMHVWPTLPSGTIASRPGPLMAAAEQFEITIHGEGGHAAMPHLTIDPIVAASSLVLNLQSIVSRTISPLDAGVVSVTQLKAGDSFNVIPEEAVLKGTVRALSTEMLIELREKVAHRVESTAMAHGCNSTIQFSPDFYPPTVNDPDLFPWSKSVGELVSPENKVRDTVPTMGGEDFSFLAQVIPSTFFWIGQGTGGNEQYHIPRTDYGLHHPSFALDEDVLPIGVELHVNLALRSLKKLLQESEEVTKAEL